MWDPLDIGSWLYQRPSFREPVTPPAADVCDSPLVCISINQSWVPYVLGACMQLAQPSTWKVADDAARAEVLGRVTDLLAQLGELVACNTAPAAITGVSTAQQACNIAGYLANLVIKESIRKAIEAINDNQTVLGYGVIIIGAIPGAGLVMNFLAKALYGLYQSISGGTLSDYNDAIDDASLWSKITCAIYNAIVTDGQVTDGNFATIESNIAAVSYTHGDVMTAIENYVSDLGASGLEQLQGTGALAVYDCSSCGTGVSTGPGGPPVLEQSGNVETTILAGTGSITGIVLFPEPFAAAPMVLVSTQLEGLEATVSSITTTQFTLTVAAPVDVTADTTSVVDWIARLKGAS